MFMQKIRISVVAILFSTVMFSSLLLADTFVCEDGFFVLGPTDVVDDVLILDGGILLMDGTTVTGDIEIEQGGTLAASRTMIAGKIRGESAMLVDLTLCDIGRGIELKKTGGSGDVFGLLPSISIQACDIFGNLKISRSDVNSITIRDNIIHGKLELTRNKSKLPIVVENNTILRRKVCD